MMADDSHPGPAASAAVDFALRLARALHTYGYPAPQLEDVLDSASQQLGLDGQFFSTPTSLFAAFGPQREQRTYLVRVRPGETNLAKLSDLYEVTKDVVAGEMGLDAGAARIDQIVSQESAYGPGLTTLAFGMASASAARFLGGGWREIAVAAGVGVVIGLISLLANRSPGASQLFEPFAAFVASVLVALTGFFVSGLSVFVASIAGLIVLVPGLTVTVAMRELATRHLVSGTARLAGAFVVFVGMAFGLAVGNRLLVSVLGPIPPGDVAAPGQSTMVLVLALILGSLGFAVLLKARARDAGWIMLAGALAYAGGTAGARLLGPELGVFLGALGVGLGSNLFARLRDRPSAVMSVPGILILVPGSVGFRGFVSMLDQQVLAGVEAAFTMMLMAVSLAAGLLIANVMVPAGSLR